MTTISNYLDEVKAILGHILNGRIEAARRLIAAGKVVEFDDSTWIVGSERDPHKRYVVMFNLGWHCTCPDCQGTGWHPAPMVEFYGGVQPTCKHIIAAAVMWAAGDDIPFDGRPVPTRYAEEVRRDYGLEPPF